MVFQSGFRDTADFFQQIKQLTGKIQDSVPSTVNKTKHDRTGLTNILKPEQLLQRPVSIKRPGF